MNNDYKKIPGNATYGKDGALLEKLLADGKKQVRILECGTFYGRHAVLWSSILDEKGVDYLYHTLDEENYLGSWDAHIIAKKNLGIHAKKVERLLVKSLDEHTAELNKLFPQSSIDIIAIDMEYNPEKLSRILSRWHNSVLAGGHLKWYIPFPDMEKSVRYQDALEELEQSGFEILQDDHIRYAKKNKTKKINTKQNKTRQDIDENVEQTSQESQ